MKKYISKLHYLTQDLPHLSHTDQVQMACEGGANWIQYRCFSKTDEEMLEELHPIATICDDWGATLIVTNHSHLLHLADIQGVHIEDIEADITMVREQIGETKTLGVSATSLAQIKKHINNGADYISCGPFAYTETKPNNFELWGIKGYQTVCETLKSEGLTLPIIAVGGIKTSDVVQLMDTGISGIAVSGAINLSESITEAYAEIHRLVY
ncbi:MAG TPA: thiamine phosphate synthase [Pelobium sp.]|nr:thiamine phosphate synthase [Pelobium sp.]